MNDMRMKHGIVMWKCNVSLTVGDCKAICWTTCSYVGFTSYFPNGTKCKYYHGTWEPANLISADVSVNI